KKETIKGISLPEARAAKRLFPQMAPNFNQPFVPPPPAAAPNFGQAFNGFGNRGFQNPVPGQRSVLTTTFRVDDRFTTRHQEGSLIITVTGTVADGKSKVNKIQVEDGRETHSYDS